jgi:hypothetical protein
MTHIKEHVNDYEADLKRIWEHIKLLITGRQSWQTEVIMSYVDQVKAQGMGGPDPADPADPADPTARRTKFVNPPLEVAGRVVREMTDDAIGAMGGWEQIGGNVSEQSVRDYIAANLFLTEGNVDFMAQSLAGLDPIELSKGSIISADLHAVLNSAIGLSENRIGDHPEAPTRASQLDFVLQGLLDSGAISPGVYDLVTLPPSAYQRMHRGGPPPDVSREAEGLMENLKARLPDLFEDLRHFGDTTDHLQDKMADFWEGATNDQKVSILPSIVTIKGLRSEGLGGAFGMGKSLETAVSDLMALHGVFDDGSPEWASGRKGLIERARGLRARLFEDGTTPEGDIGDIVREALLGQLSPTDEMAEEGRTATTTGPSLFEQRVSQEGQRKEQEEASKAQAALKTDEDKAIALRKNLLFRAGIPKGSITEDHMQRILSEIQSGVSPERILEALVAVSGAWQEEKRSIDLVARKPGTDTGPLALEVLNSLGIVSPFATDREKALYATAEEQIRTAFQIAGEGDPSIYQAGAQAFAEDVFDPIDPFTPGYGIAPAGGIALRPWVPDTLLPGQEPPFSEQAEPLIQDAESLHLQQVGDVFRFPTQHEIGVFPLSDPRSEVGQEVLRQHFDPSAPPSMPGIEPVWEMINGRRVNVAAPPPFPTQA